MYFGKCTAAEKFLEKRSHLFIRKHTSRLNRTMTATPRWTNIIPRKPLLQMLRMTPMSTDNTTIR